MSKPISEYLKENREKLKLTQAQMAEKLDVPFRTYQDWEYENRIPKPITQEAIKARVKEIKGD